MNIFFFATLGTAIAEQVKLLRVDLFVTDRGGDFHDDMPAHGDLSQEFGGLLEQDEIEVERWVNRSVLE